MKTNQSNQKKVKKSKSNVKPAPQTTPEQKGGFRYDYDDSSDV